MAVRTPTYPFKMGGLVLNSRRGVRVLRFLDQAWAERRQGFALIVPPEQIYRPEEFDTFDELTKAVWIWNQGFSQRSGKLATDILGNLYVVHIDHPELTRLANLADAQIDVLTECIRKVEPFADSKKSALQRERALWWRDMWKLLRDSYNGDQREFFYRHRKKGASIWKQRDIYIRELSKLKGVQHKVAQLMIGFFQEYHTIVGWRENKDFWDWFSTIPVVPVDLHHMRGVPRAGLVEEYENDRRDTIAKPLSDWFCWLCWKNGINHMNVAQAFFNIGATIHARNALIKDEAERAAHCVDDCPMHAFCVYNVSTDQVQNLRKSTRDKVEELKLRQAKAEEEDRFDLIQDIATEIAALLELESKMERNRGSMQWKTRTPRDPHAIALLAKRYVSVHRSQLQLFEREFSRADYATNKRKEKLGRIRHNGKNGSAWLQAKHKARERRLNQPQQTALIGDD